MPEKLIILGSGPAGLTAAIYAARAGLNPLLIRGSQAGGQLMITTSVDNYPGFPSGIQGPDLMTAMQSQAERFGTRIIEGDVERAHLKRRPFELVAGKSVYKTEALIISTGATARWLGISSETALRGRGVSSCATCDGFFFKGQDMVVVGGGDTAIEEAIYLAKLARSVTIVHRRDEFRASKAMQDRIKAESNISVVWDSVVEEIRDVDKGKVTSVLLKNVKTGQVTEKKCNGVFIAIGHVPNTGLFKGQLDMDKNGYLKVNGVATSIEGVFAAGDVCDPSYKQAVVAAGMGCMAAIDAERWLMRGKSQ